PRLAGSGRARPAAGGALRLHPAPGAGLGRARDGGEHPLSAAAPAGEPGAADQRVARGGEAQEALLPAVAHGRSDAVGPGRRVAGHLGLAGQDSLKRGWETTPWT